jgi:hypothetical protein
VRVSLEVTVKETTYEFDSYSLRVEKVCACIPQQGVERGEEERRWSAHIADNGWYSQDRMQARNVSREAGHAPAEP